jgi:hypothetical protein
MQQHDFNARLPQARVLTEEELLQTRGGNLFNDVFKWLRGAVDPLPVSKPLANAIQRAWNAIKQAA